MKDDRLTLGFIMGALAAGCISCSVCFTIHGNLKADAIDKGYAEWTVDNRGNTAWQWKRPCRPVGTNTVLELLTEEDLAAWNEGIRRTKEQRKGEADER